MLRRKLRQDPDLDPTTPREVGQLRAIESAVSRSSAVMTEISADLRRLSGLAHDRRGLEHRPARIHDVRSDDVVQESLPRSQLTAVGNRVATVGRAVAKMNFAITTSSFVGTDPLPALYLEDESRPVEMDRRLRTRRLSPITNASSSSSRPTPDVLRRQRSSQQRILAPLVSALALAGELRFGSAGAAQRARRRA